ncbi:class I SAM-dependent methyltransferase [Bdellovibrio svalbardensis]|uniref:Class I SAM-dependent methyltransferase n=1 Tax=Bdellovibrio svalbardensis TaxID=2972972 RepID=A0ABT6DMM1_9BACT|nr:class I SAM-dependent methyltransferase [Bdellovibrio svalbardensis]MDG0817757.1 class I SAM-dependent methyltransferase [Bdellovibrio svalbardensis]
MECLLCQTPHSAAFKVVKKPERSYYHCAQCDLIFMNPKERLDAAQEKARYDFHQNEDMKGYRAFLEPLVKDVEQFAKNAKREPSDVSVLDYGCGPTAFLGNWFTEKSFRVTNYDLYYFPDQDSLKKSYHVITSTEVWEHLYDPRAELVKMIKMLKTGGILAVMTSSHKGEAAFHDWYYRRDLTHVTFFSEKTMKWIADHFNLQLIKGRSPYWIFQKWDAQTPS